MKNISQNIEYLMKKAMDPGQDTFDSTKDENKGRGELYTPPHARNQNQGQLNQNYGQVNLQANNHMVRLKFPEFNGENPQSWIWKPNRFFQIMLMNEVANSGYYMIDVADVLYMEYIEGKEGIKWNDFCEMIMSRFLRPGKEDVIIEFTKLQQSSDINSYQVKFDELKALICVRNSSSLVF